MLTHQIYPYCASNPQSNTRTDSSTPEADHYERVAAAYT